MEISELELDKIKAESMLEGSLIVMSGFRLGIKEASRFVSHMSMEDILTAVDESIKVIKEEGKNL